MKKRTIILIVSVLAVLGINYFYGLPKSKAKKVDKQDQKELANKKIANAVEEENNEQELSIEEKFDKKCENYSNYFLLYNILIEVNDDFSYATKFHKKVKILKESAKNMGQIPVPYDKGRQEITEFKAWTITPDGKKYKYSQMQDLNLYRGFSVFSNYRYKLATLPKVNVGSVLEYITCKESKKDLIENAFWNETHAAFSVPVKEANFTISVPKSANIKYRPCNLEYEPVITETEDRITYSWHIENFLPEDDYEDYLPPPTFDDLKNVVQFSSIPSWDDFAKWMNNKVEQNMVISEAITNKVNELIEPDMSLKEKVLAVKEYIQDNFRYISMSFGKHAFEPHPSDQVFENQYGDCKDLVVLTKAMLKVAGVESNFVLFQDEFSISDPKDDLVVPNLFDHAILLVKDEKEGDFFLDPLLDGYNIEEYPMFYQNAYTLVINNDGGEFKRFPIFDETRDSQSLERSIDVYPDGSALITVNKILNLDESISLRMIMKDISEEQLADVEKSLSEQYAQNGEMISQRIEGWKKKYGRLTSYIKYKEKNYFQVIDDLIIMSIGQLSGNGEFVAEERTNPIFFTDNAVYEKTVFLTIPEGYRVRKMPKDINLDIGFFNVTREFQGINISNQLVYRQVKRFRRKLLPVEEYPKIKKFHKELSGKTEQYIVLEKEKTIWQDLYDIIKKRMK